MEEEKKIEIYQEIIDKLLHKHRLTENEESIIKNDKAFLVYQKELEIISGAITKSSMNKKLEEVKALENSFSSNKPKKNGRRMWLSAAAMLLLLAGVYFFMKMNDGASYDKDLLLAGNIPYYPDIDASRSSDSSNENIAYQKYKDAEYELAIQEFEKLVSTDKNPKHKFYLALCLLNTENYQAAQNILQDESLKNYKEVPLNFYLGLSKIGTDDRKEAIELLSNPTIVEPLLDNKREKFLRILKR